MTETSPKRPPLRVLLVDDHEVVRSGVRALLQATDDIIVTAEAGTVREARDPGKAPEDGRVIMLTFLWREAIPTWISSPS